jgi:hypothetical protein
MNTKSVEKVFRAIFIIVFMVGIVYTPGTSVLAQASGDTYDPSFTVWLNQNKVDGYGWPENTQVTLTVGEVQVTETVGNSNLGSQGISFQFGDEFQLLNGQTVTLSDETGMYTRTHTITDLIVTDISTYTDIVTGTAAAGSDVQINNKWDEGIWRHELAASNGSWTADFTIVGDEPGEEIADIKPGEEYHVCQAAQDGSTCWYLPLSNPSFSVRANEDRIEGWEWPIGATVMVTIDDSTTSDDPDPIYATVGVADWDPNQTWFNVNIENYDLKSGDTVNVTYGSITKTHTVTSLAFTDVNIDDDLVTGVAASESHVDVWACDNNGNCVNRHVDANAGGIWIADFRNYGDEDDEQNTFNIIPGTWIDSSQGDDDGDSTMFGVNVPDPRIEVSYEHDWIQIRDFTPGGDVTYTIYDYEGGHALFGPVTGPVDSHGDGWISYNLHHTDLIPGNYITAKNEATGEEVSILIRDLNLDYVDVVNDRAFGTAVPNSTIELHIDETHNQGFSLTAAVDGSGYWEVDLAAAGHPIDEYRRANINLYDAEGDNIVAQPPRVHGEIRSDNMGVDNFSKNSDVTLTMYDSPGGAVLYGPTTLRTDGSGSAWVNLYQLGIDLVPGNYIVAYDHHLGFTKDLEVEPFTIDGMNTADDIVYGTSAVGEWVEIHVESLFSNWGLDALTDDTYHWTRDYGAENYDITDQMWANGWATDDQDNWSEDHTTGLPGLEASIAGDWISGFNFSPDRQVRIRIYTSESGSLLADTLVTAQGDTQVQADYSQHGVDLQAGMYIIAEDLETGKYSELTLVPLTFDGVNYDDDTAWGTANEGTQVVVRANHLFDSYEMTVIANESNEWSADFSYLGVSLTPDWGLRAMVFDLEFDATVADAPQPPQFTASLSSDWINGNNWTPNNNVTIMLYEYENGPAIGDPFVWDTDTYGNFNADLRNEGIDLLPGNYIKVTDKNSSIVKSLTLPNLTIDYLDPDSDVAGGQAPADTRLSIDFNNQQENIQFDLFSESNGMWEADFGAHDFDLQPGSSGTVIIFDDDGDGTQVEGYVPNPHFTVYPVWEAVEAYDWPDGATVSASVSGKDACTAGGTAGYPEWDPSTTNVWMNFPEDCDVVVGDTVTITDGVTQVSHVVQYLTVTEANAESDYVSGTANSGTVVYVWPHGYGEYEVQPIAADGTWLADFAVFGDILQPGTDGRSEVRDVNGNATAVDWHVPSPHFTVYPEWEAVEAWDWPDGALITASVSGKDACTAEGIAGYPEWDPSTTNVWMNFPEDCDVTEGDVVTLTADGMDPQTHVVRNLSVTNVNVETNTVSGTADSGTVIYVWPHCCGEYEVQPTAGTDGHWNAVFPEEFSLEPGMNGRSEVRDVNGNATAVDWQVPNPNIRAITNEDRVDGWQWTAGATATLTIDDPGTLQNPDFTAYGAVGFDEGNGQTYVNIGLGDYDLKPGDIVTLTDGTATKSVTATSVTVTNVDVNTNVVTGTAEPGSQVWSAACQYGDCSQRTTTADLDGNWSIDFDEDMPGQPNVDIVPGGSVDGEQFDDDGDSTLYTWGVPNPTFGVRVNYNSIEGWEWPLGATVTIEIAGWTDHEPLTATVGVADWDPNQTYFSLNIENYDLQTGDTVTVTDGNTTKELTITPFEITGYDLDTEMVYGEAGENQYVNVWTCWQNDPCIGRDETADASGYWETDFSVPGEQDWEQETADLRPGSWIDSSVSDEDGDQILFGVNVPSYTLHVVPAHPEVHGHDWPQGEDITLIIDDDTNTGNGVLYTQTKNADDDPWCGYPCFDLTGLFDLEVGQYVTMTDGNVSKTVQVSVLTITEVDIENDILRGVADPGSRVAVNIWSQDGLARYVTTEPDGTWEADFSVFGDEEFEQFTTDITSDDNGRAIQLNPDGSDDGTLEYWFGPFNQPPADVVITAPADPLPVSELVSLQVEFTDPDENDSHTVAVDWGDMITTDATVTDHTAVADHQYQSAGVYTINVTVTDTAGESAQGTYQYVVIYDPDGGFVTGGGWINSPEGAYTPDPTLTGKATFGFVSKYKKGAKVPTGNTEFQFKVADLNFKSTSYDWLVIAGSKAMYKGTGTINGAGEYGFMLSAIDGTPDKFRIKIWDKATDKVVYDNQLGAVEDAEPATELGGGSIVVHKK